MRTIQLLLLVSLLALPMLGYGIWAISNSSQLQAAINPIDPLAPIDVAEKVVDQRPRSEAIFDRFRSIDQHTSFWQCMDTLRDKRLLQKLWDDGNPPWKIWS